jgi:hypothetical protein
MNTTLKNPGKVIIFFFALMIVLSCCETDGSSGLEFVGTWIAGTVGVASDTITATSTTITRDTDMGEFVGTITISITSYDEEVNHIQGTVTAATGIYDGSVGLTVYILYVIDGNSMMFGADTDDYPPEEDLEGPYEKQ